MTWCGQLASRRAVLQVIEANGVMARVAAGGLQPHPGGKNMPDRYDLVRD